METERRSEFVLSFYHVIIRSTNNCSLIILIFYIAFFARSIDLLRFYYVFVSRLTERAFNV